MAEVPEDIASSIISFLTPIFHQVNRRPVVVGVSGGQGSGKTTLTKRIADLLRAPPHNLNVVVFSIDDIYLTHEDQVKLAEANPQNPLVQVRGEPGTHDVELGKSVMSSLLSQKPTKIPFYDKSCFKGAGDRTDPQFWDTAMPHFDVVLFEGWCVGFKALEPEEIKSKLEQSRKTGLGVIRNHRLEDLLFVNEQLLSYDALTNEFDASIHLDTEELRFIYDWRLEQEHGLIQLKGTGMTDSQVKAFVDCYMPAYELYVANLRTGAVSAGRQLRIVVGRDRSTSSISVV